MGGCGCGVGTWGGDKNAAMWLHCHFSSLIMGVDVAVLANPDTMHGNAARITYGRAISEKAVWCTKQRWVMSARKIPFLLVSDNPIMRGNSTD